MVIYLLDELIDDLNTTEDNSRYSKIFEVLADSYYYNFNYLIGDRRIIEFLSQYDQLNDRALYIYKYIHNRYTSEYNILNYVSFNVQIGVQNEINTNFNKINIEELVFNSFLCHNGFLLEYVTDQYIYKLMVDKYLSDIDLVGQSYQWEIYNGGGNTTRDEYVRLTNLKQKLIFSLIDSDKISRDCELGQTSRAFGDFNEFVFGKFKILEAHEVENLIPKSIYLRYIAHKNDQNLNRNISKLEMVNDLYYFLDLKRGLTKKKLRNTNITVKRNYIEELNLTEEDLSCTCGDQCNCFIIIPFGRVILKEIVDFIAVHDINVINESCDYLSNMYHSLGKELYEIYCHPNHRVI